jgi:hypothetical protein
MTSISLPSLPMLLLMLAALATQSYWGHAATPPQCTLAMGYGQAVSHTQPCMCATGMVCDPSEICNIIPDDAGEQKCLKVPCDDLRGSWIWVGLSSALNAATVWGLVTVEQTPVCQQPIFTVTSNRFNAAGTTVKRTFFGLLGFREIYYFTLFDTKEDRDASEITFSENADPSYKLFVQDFGNGAPVEQCLYFGSFTEPFFNETTSLGTFARDVKGKYSLGGIIAEDDYPSLFSCTDGYPRNFIATTPNSPSPTTTTNAPAKKGKKKGKGKAKKNKITK